MDKENKHPIESLMNDAMDKIKKIVDVNTVIGDTIKTIDGTYLIPITKVSAGFVAGGGEYSQNIPPKNAKKQYPFAGGSGCGFNITPIGFLVGKHDKIEFISIENKSAYENLFKIAADLTSKLK